ncbi:MAG: MDR/zinc-dependent alcohol dehydrogenase-like family protein [Desulfomonilaceae bacterium]
MKALYFNGVELELQERAIPKIAQGQSLVKIALAGICRTDLEIFKGYMNFKGVPGHEFVGTVQESSDSAMVGNTVVGEINAGCGECSFCKAGLERHCERRTVLGIAGMDGVFAQYVVLPTANLCVVPESVSEESAVFVEPIAAATEILEQTHIAPASDTLIIGDGRLAYLIFLILRLTGSNLTVASKHQNKRALFERMGATVISSSEIPQYKKRFDFVVEASGSPTGWNLGVSLVKPRGVIILKSTYHGDLDVEAARLVINEITIVGSRCGRFRPALNLLERGLINPTVLISEVFDLDDFSTAFEKASDGKTFKVLFRM